MVGEGCDPFTHPLKPTIPVVWALQITDLCATREEISGELEELRRSYGNEPVPSYGDPNRPDYRG